MNDRTEAGAVASEPGTQLFARRRIKLILRLPRRLLDFLFGYDYFISYAWSDGHTYAEMLCEQLKKANFAVFLDRDKFAKGDNWKKIAKWTLRRTSQLILVRTKDALKSPPVRNEVATFYATGRRIIPIDFDATTRFDANNPLAEYLPSEILVMAESKEALKSGPTAQVLADLRNTFNLVTQAQRRFRVLVATAAIFACLTIFAGLKWWDAKVQLDHANDALAHGIWNDLTFVDDISLTDRELSAFWQLAGSDKAVHEHFTRQLNLDPEYVLRFGAHPAFITRALGLEANVDSKPGIDLLITTFENSTAVNKLPRFVRAFISLAERFSADQAMRTFELLEMKKNYTSDASVLDSLDKSLKALSGRLKQSDAVSALTAMVDHRRVQLNQQPEDADARWLGVDVALALAQRLDGPSAGKTLDAFLLQSHDLKNTKSSEFRESIAPIIGSLTIKMARGEAESSVDALLHEAERSGRENDFTSLEIVVEGAKALGPKATARQGRAAFETLMKAPANSSPGLTNALTEVASALSTNLDKKDVQEFIDPILDELPSTRDPERLYRLVSAILSLEQRMSDDQAQRVLGALTQALEKATDYFAVSSIATAVPALAAKAAGPQCDSIRNAVLMSMRENTHPGSLAESVELELTRAFVACTKASSEAQTQSAMDTLLADLSKAQPNSTAASYISEALHVLSRVVSVAQKREASAALLKAIRKTTDPSALLKLVEALGSFDVQAAEAQQAFKVLLKAARDSSEFPLPIGKALSVMASAVPPAQSLDAMKLLLQAASKTSDEDALQSLTETAETFASKLDESRAGVALEASAALVTSLTEQRRASAVAKIAEAIAVHVSSIQAGQTLQHLLGVLQSEGDPEREYMLSAFQVEGVVQVSRALVSKLSPPQAESAFKNALDGMKANFFFDYEVEALGEISSALAARMTKEQSEHGLVEMYDAMLTTTMAKDRLAEAEAARSLAGAIPQAKAQAVLELILKDMRESPGELRHAARTIQALGPRLTSTQARLALDAVLSSLSQQGTDLANAREQEETQMDLARAADVLTKLLTDAQSRAMLATGKLQSALGWSARPDESFHWTQAICSILSHVHGTEVASTVVTLVKYPIAAGPVTDALIRRVREITPTAPDAASGLNSQLSWIGRTYPGVDLKSRPDCPTPTRTGLSCRG